jgi:hypothetical protein
MAVRGIRPSDRGGIDDGGRTGASTPGYRADFAGVGASAVESGARGHDGGHDMGRADKQLVPSAALVAVLGDGGISDRRRRPTPPLETEGGNCSHSRFGMSERSKRPSGGRRTPEPTRSWCPRDSPRIRNRHVLCRRPLRNLAHQVLEPARLLDGTRREALRGRWRAERVTVSLCFSGLPATAFARRASAALANSADELRGFDGGMAAGDLRWALGMPPSYRAATPAAE